MDTTAELHDSPVDQLEHTVEEGILARVKVNGEQVTSFPVDLYIPPDALEVILEIFEGPLDLLLYLIKKHNLDILNISVSEITHQYIKYVELMTTFHLELAAEYLEMAALLAEIKSRMLLPKTKDANEEEEDPRAELVRRLQEYECFKEAAANLEQIPREGRDFYALPACPPPLQLLRPLPVVDLKEILLAFREVLKRVDLQTGHTIQREILSVRQRMSLILEHLSADKFTDIVEFFDVSEGRLGMIVTFLAVLELVKEAIIELSQVEPFGPIYVKASA